MYPENLTSELMQLQLLQVGPKRIITEFLYGANVLIFDWFCFNLEEKGVFISKFRRKV